MCSCLPADWKCLLQLWLQTWSGTSLQAQGWGWLWRWLRFYPTSPSESWKLHSEESPFGYQPVTQTSSLKNILQTCLFLWNRRRRLSVPRLCGSRTTADLQELICWKQPLENCLGMKSCSMNEFYLGDTQGSHILTKRGGAIACAKGPCQQRADPFNANAPVDGVLRGRRGPWQLGACMVVAHGLCHGAYYSSHHAKNACQAHRWHAPLTWGRGQNYDYWMVHKNIQVFPTILSLFVSTIHPVCILFFSTNMTYKGAICKKKKEKKRVEYVRN